MPAGSPPYRLAHALLILADDIECLSPAYPLINFTVVSELSSMFIPLLGDMRINSAGGFQGGTGGASIRSSIYYDQCKRSRTSQVT